jgi:oligosaccharide repeat unit polymerase
MFNDFLFIILNALLSVLLIIDFKSYRYPSSINPLFFFILGVLLFIALPYFIDPVMKNYSYNDFTKVAVYTIIGTFSFFIGWLMISKRQFNNDFKLLYFKPKLLSIYIFFFIGLLIQYFLLKKFGSSLLERIILIRGASGICTDNIWESFWRIPYSFSFGFINASSFLAIYFLIKNQITNRFFKLLTIFIYLIAIILNFSTGTRMNIFTILFGPIIIYLYNAKSIKSLLKIKSLIFIGFIFAVLFGLIAVLSSIRDTGLKSEFNIDFLNIVTYGLNQVPDFNSAIAMFPKEKNFLYGSTYLAVLVNPIPREFFPNKPVGIGAIIGEVDPISRAGTSISITFFGESYANFGIMGVIIMPFIWGFISKVLFSWFRKNYNSDIVKIIYFYILPFYTIEVRGGFLEITMRLLIEFLSLLLIIKTSIKYKS